MASKDKVARDAQKTYWEGVLSRRLNVLKESSLEPKKIAKDTSIRKIRAEIRKIGARLAVIDKKEKKIKEMAKIKAEKTSIPKEEKAKKTKTAEETLETSKRQQKLKKKMEKKEEKKQAKDMDKG
ncbi:MAG: hypothetical protein U9N37_04700 [Thermodesulfobacteriota bacterium]|nr:hypothetical protein [Thermodesulfobacteriota bacterium]